MHLPLKCSNCGEYLDGDINNKGEVEVNLCSACEIRIRNEGYDKGYDEGYREGSSEIE